MNFIQRFISRAFLWKLFLSSFKGTSLIAELNLFLSGLIDIIFYMVSGWAYNPKTIFSGVYIVKEYGFYVFSRGGTDDLYYAIPCREGDVHEFITSKLEKGDVFVDVGANIGYYTILASKIVGDEGRVFAIEPIPQTVAVLRFNVRLNGLSNIIISDKAAWFENAVIELRLQMKEYGCASAFHYGNGEEIEVQGVPLDQILKGITYIDLKESLANTQSIVLELPRKREECLSLLREYGFNCRKSSFTTYYICEKACNRGHYSC